MLKTDYESVTTWTGEVRQEITISKTSILCVQNQLESDEVYVIKVEP